MYCTNCGKEVPEGANCCPDCGNTIPQQTKLEKVQQNKSSIMISLIGVISLLLVITLVMGAFITVNHIKNNSVRAGKPEIVAAETMKESGTDEYLEENSTEPGGQESEKVKDTPDFEVSGDTCMGGNVKVTVADISADDNRVTLRIENNAGETIEMFGNPLQIIGSKSMEIDPAMNMASSSTQIVNGTYSDIPLYLDEAFFEEGGKLSGSLWIMDPKIQDCDYIVSIDRS